ncbi:CAP domain-containing protein [Lysinibacillus sp. 54212]|uniref:CAP and S-layer homology domain-containing protein n=1 Tax=Lysinibacillus sp. 54212 TaxID=3119829 RepID=UPI002FC6BB15
MKKLFYLFTICLIIVSFTPETKASELIDKDTFYSNQIFPDVNRNYVFFKPIQWAYNNGIIVGSNGKFNPNDTVSEEQFAKMYTNFFNFPNVKTDQNGSKAWSDVYYARLGAYNAPLNGYGSTALRHKPISRGLLAQLVAFAHGKDYDLESAVTYLMDSGISSGQYPHETNPIKRFGATNTLSRAQAVTFLYRMYQQEKHQLETGTSSVFKDLSFSMHSMDSYGIGGKVYAAVIQKAYNGYELAFVSENHLIGGYLTKSGTTFEGYTIGSPYTGEKIVTKNNKRLTILVDEHNKNKIDAIYWTSTTEFAKKQFATMHNDNSAKKTESLEFLMAEITNATRVKHGLVAFKYDKKLASVAKSHSVDMYKNNYFDHDSLKGLSPFDRMKAAGLSYRVAAENLARSYTTIFEAHNGLYNSPGHRKNILNSSLKNIGIGVHHNYYTINFITYF